MTVSNLLKRKINFRLTHEENRYHEKRLQYTSMIINKLNIGSRPHWWVYMNSIRPFIVHFISKIVTEESERIDRIGIFVKWLILREGRDTFEGTVIIMSLKNPKVGIQQFPSNPDRRVFFFRQSAMNESYKIEVVSFIGMPTIMPDGWREEESDEEEPYTPPIKPYREDCCIACFEPKPNILYLDSLHIVICDSCDRLKKTGRKNCDVCRAEISRRIAL